MCYAFGTALIVSFALRLTHTKIAFMVHFEMSDHLGQYSVHSCDYRPVLCCEVYLILYTDFQVSSVSEETWCQLLTTEEWQKIHWDIYIYIYIPTFENTSSMWFKLLGIFFHQNTEVLRMMISITQNLHLTTLNLLCT